MKLMAVDFETYLISDESPIPKPVCLSYYDGSNPTGLLIGSDMESFLRKVLEQDYTIIAHNATFECKVIYQHMPELRSLLWQALDEGRIFCTQIYQELLNNISKNYGRGSLADLVKLYLKIDISADKKGDDAWRLRYGELDGIPLDQWPEKAISYAKDDSYYAYTVRLEQFKINKLLKYSNHISASVALNLMADRGFKVDLDRVSTLDKELMDILTPRYLELEQLDLMNRDKRGKLSKNVKGLQDYIQKNIPNIFKTAQNRVKVSGEALDKYLIQAPDDRALRLFREIGKYEKAKTAFTNRLLTVKDLIRTSYNPIVSSGRTSSRASDSMPSVNIQQMPRGLDGVTWDIRNCFIPRPGYKLVTIDYCNLELLACGHQLYNYYGWGKMRDIINSGHTPRDMHSIFACDLMSSDVNRSISYDHFVEHKKDKGYKEYRQKSKPVTLGVPGGMGFDTIRVQFIKDGIHLPYRRLKAYYNEYVAQSMVRKYRSQYPNLRVERTGRREFTVVEDEVVKLKKILFRLYPEMEQFLRFDHQKFQMKEMRYYKDEYDDLQAEPYYAYNTCGFRRKYCTYTAFCNGFLLQTPSAAGAKRAVELCFREFEYNDEVYPLAFIHDEIIFEIKDNENLTKNVDRAAELMCLGMKEILPSVRIACEAEVKPYWSKDYSEWGRKYWINTNSKELHYD